MFRLDESLALVITAFFTINPNLLYIHQLVYISKSNDGGLQDQYSACKTFLNSYGQTFQQHQQNEQLPLNSNNITQKTETTRRVWKYQREVIIIRKSKKDWQHNGQQKDKKTDNILQNTTQKIKGRATRTPLKASGEFRCSGRVGSSSFIGGTRRVAPVALEIQVLARDRDMWMVSTGFTIKHVLNVCFFTSILLI